MTRHREGRQGDGELPAAPWVGPERWRHRGGPLVSALHVLSVIAGTILILSILLSAIETVVLPRLGFTRIAQMVFALLHRAMVHRAGPDRIRRRGRDLFAPMALVSLPLVWTVGETIGFAFVYWGFHIGNVPDAVRSSGSALFTLGFSEPPGSGLVWLTFVEATIGLGLVALLISYLPTIYAGYNQRERGVGLLRPIAGVPPTATQLLIRMHEMGTIDAPDLWNRATDWLIDLEQSHCSFPALCYFPTQSPELSWVASVGAVLDSAALVLAAQDEAGVARGPAQVLAYGSTAVVRIGQKSGLPLEGPLNLADITALESGPAPAISLQRSEVEVEFDRLERAGVIGPVDRTQAWTRFAQVRSTYDRALRGLAGLTEAHPAHLTTDRPAKVGRPPFLVRRRISVDWQVVQ